MFDSIYRGRRVLVTGHTGFKGSWLALWLNHLGADVAGFSIDVPTEPSHFRLLGLENMISHYQGDIRDLEKLAAVIDKFKPEMIFHLAAQALVRRSYADPVTTFKTNVMGMMNLLECIRSRPWIETVVLITSDKVYHNNEWCWGYRETDALGGIDPYSGSKSCADILAHTYFHSFLAESPTRLAITRAGNVIGGGDWSEDRIVPDCVRAWSAGKSVAVRSPDATRPWQHVLEPLSGYLWLGAQLWRKREALNGEAFNFGPDADIDQTVEELLKAMALRWTDVHWHVPEQNMQGSHEATLLKLSCDKVLFHLKWRAVLKFPETVAFTIDWYRNWHIKGQDIRSFSANQIDEYCQLAADRSLIWTTT